MLKLKLKKGEKQVKDDEKIESTENVVNAIVAVSDTEETSEKALTAVGTDTELVNGPTEIVKADEVEIGIKFEDSKTKAAAKAMSEFSRLADILGKDEQTVLEECKLYEIKKIMSYVNKAVVRYGITEDDARVIINNSIASGYGGVAISPAYLKTFSDSLREKEEIKVSAVIDFPFGESSFKVKHAEMKNAIKAGVDEILTVFPANLLQKESAKELKNQLKKTKRVGRVDKAVAVNAEDVNSEDIKRFMRLAEKMKMKYVAFLFGNVTANELCDKMREIIANKNKIAVKVMANVEDVEGVKTLIAEKADGIITPFTDKIAKELFEEFKITSVKLY